jgi:hypothetical protein
MEFDRSLRVEIGTFLWAYCVFGVGGKVEVGQAFWAGVCDLSV